MTVKCLAQEHNSITPPGLEPRPLDGDSNTQTIRPPCVHHCVSRLGNYYGMHDWPHGIMVNTPDSRSKVNKLCFWQETSPLLCLSLPKSIQEMNASKQSRNLLKCWEGGNP